jgi:hypothetical protein
MSDDVPMRRAGDGEGLITLCFRPRNGRRFFAVDRFEIPSTQDSRAFSNSVFFDIGDFDRGTDQLAGIYGHSEAVCHIGLS